MPQHEHLSSIAYSVMRPCRPGSGDASAASCAPDKKVESVAVAVGVLAAISHAIGKEVHNPGIAYQAARDVAPKHAERIRRAARQRNAATHHPLREVPGDVDMHLLSDLRAELDAGGGPLVGSRPLSGRWEPLSERLQVCADYRHEARKENMEPRYECMAKVRERCASSGARWEHGATPIVGEYLRCCFL